MADNNLNIGVSVTGVSQAQAEMQRLEQRVASLRDAIQNIGQSNMRGSNALFDQLRMQLSGAEKQLASFKAQLVSTYSNIESFNIRAIAAMRGQADAIKGVARELTALDSISRSRPGGGIYGMTVQDAMARSINTSTISATAHAARQRELNEAFGATEVVSARAAGGVRAYAASVREAEQAEQSWLSKFMRGGRTPMSLMDEMMRGQRGAMISTLGSGLKATGGGGIAMGGGLAALGLVVGISELMNFTKEMGKLNETIAATAQTTGMSVRQLAVLQGAMTLTGGKATDADTAVRHFADQLEKGTANSASMAAKALHAIGISQDELKAKGNDTYGMLQQVSQALNRYADDSTKAAVMTELFGRSDAAIAKFLSRFQELTPATQQYANAVEANNKKWIEADEKLNKLTLDWDTLKADMAAPVIATVDIVVRGLDALSNALSMLSAVGRYVGMGADSVADVNKNIEREQRRQRGEDEPSAAFAAVEGAIKLKDVNVTAPRDSRPHIKPFSAPKGGGGGRGPSPAKEEEANIEALRQQLSLLREDYRLFASEQDSLVEHQKIASRIAQGDKDISPIMRARQEFTVEQQAGAAKIARLQELKAQSAAIYAQMAGDAQKQYQEDQTAFSGAVKNKQEVLNKLTGAQKEYNRIVGEGAKAAKQFDVEIQQVQNQVDRQYLGIVEAHKQEVDKVINMWGSAFDQIGSKFEDTMGQAIKSAFEPMKPEYWWTASSGPGGVPLMHAHRINPMMQLFGNFGMSALGDIGKTLMSSIGTSISKSLFGAGTESFGQGIAKLIGAGSPGGIFGTGLGAVSAVDAATKQASEATFATSVATFASAVATFAASSASGGAGSLLGGGAAAASGGGFFGWLGSLFSGPALATGGLYARGGIVPSAAGGWALGSFPGATPALLHQREMVLPEHISTGLQNMIANGGGGSTNIHFHGPADAPSISRWFQNNMARNSGVVRQMFHSNALTPRSL